MIGYSKCFLQLSIPWNAEVRENQENTQVPLVIFCKLEIYKGNARFSSEHCQLPVNDTADQTTYQ